MSEKFLIDTSVFVEGEIDPRVLVDWLARQDDVATSEVVRAEFSVGIHAPSAPATRERAQKFFTDYILPVPALPVLSQEFRDRKSTRLNSSHANISYAVFSLK